MSKPSNKKKQRCPHCSDGNRKEYINLKLHFVKSHKYDKELWCIICNDLAYGLYGKEQEPLCEVHKELDYIYTVK